MGNCVKRVKIKINSATVNALSEDIKKAAHDTMEILKDEVVNSRTMPFDNGTMQNTETNTVLLVNDKIHSYLVTNVPYARYQYYGRTKDGKELNYQKANNLNARSHWLEPYIDGEFIKSTFAKRLAERLNDK